MLSLRDPKIPGIDNATWTRIFRGWSKTSFDDTDENLVYIDSLQEELNAKNNEDFIEGTLIDLYANLKDVYYVTYVDVNPNNVLATDIIPVSESGQTTFRIKSEGELRPTITSDSQLEGWFDINDRDTIYDPGEEGVALSSSIKLYPKVDGGYWLIFDDNDPVWSVEKQAYVSGGASFTPPAFYLNENTDKPADPAWTGYEFAGWYTDQECTTPFVFGGRLIHDTIVYAKWNPTASSYRVVYWKQRTTDAYDAPDNEKTYDYADSRLVENAITGQVVNLNVNDTKVYGAGGSSTEADKDYFTYNATNTDQSIVVKADGSSVLNVYYDRQVITINFTGNLYHYEETSDTTGELYGLIDGAYVRVYPDGNGGYETHSTGPHPEPVTHTYSGTRYNSTDSDNTPPEQYGVYENQVVVLYYHDPWIGSSHWSRRQSHTGWGNDQEYSGTRYVVNSNGLYGFVNGEMIQLKNDGTYTTSETVADPGVAYSGTLYKCISQNGLTLRGLYGRSMYPGEWPTSVSNGSEYWWQFVNNSNGDTLLNAPWNSYTIASTASNSQIVSRTWNLTTGQKPYTGQKIYYYGENTEGNYTVLLAETSRSTDATVNIGNGKFFGYTTYGWKIGKGSIGSGNGWHALNGTDGSIGANSNTDGDIYIYYTRDKYSLTFYTNNGSNKVDVIQNVPYEKPLTSYSGHSEGKKEGYYFLGWYADPSCTEPFDFSQPMPHNNVAVYGKWALRRVRIVIEPGANNVYMGSQATTFRVNYDESIAGGLMETARRAGYILDGWYTDPEFNHPFLFTNPIRDNIEDIDWEYQEDKWLPTSIGHGDDDESNQNVRGILHLYTK